MNTTWTIGRNIFAYLHGFHWDDHRWTRPIPQSADLETYEAIVAREQPKLLTPGIGNIPPNHSQTP